jgi:hypothetical protein
VSEETGLLDSFLIWIENMDEVIPDSKAEPPGASSADLSDQDAAPRLVFDSARQGLKVWLLTWLMAAGAAATLYWGWDLLRTYGLSPGDGGVLRPLGQRIAMGAFVGSLGPIFFGGMLVFNRHYVDRIMRLGADRLRIRMMGLILRREYDVSISEAQIGKVRGLYDPNDLLTLVNTMVSGFVINTPYRTIRVPFRRWPVILDLQGEMRARKARSGPDERPSPAKDPGRPKRP